jgi:hypothetical protein
MTSTIETEDVVAAVARAICSADGDHWFASSNLTHNNRRYLKLAAAALSATPIERLREEMVAQTLLVDRLCSAVDQATEDVGHESIDGLLKLIGPQNERCIELLGGRAALTPSAGPPNSGGVE